MVERCVVTSSKQALVWQMLISLEHVALVLSTYKSFRYLHVLLIETQTLEISVIILIDRFIRRISLNLDPSILYFFSNLSLIYLRNHSIWRLVIYFWILLLRLALSLEWIVVADIRLDSANLQLLQEFLLLLPLLLNYLPPS